MVCATAFSQDINVDGNVWQSNNLSTRKYSNGDVISEAKTSQDWFLLNAEKKGCFIEFNGKIYYNSYAISDIRALAPNGYRIATNDDWNGIINFVRRVGKYDPSSIKSKSGWHAYVRNTNRGTRKPQTIECNGSNETGFNATPCGYFSGNEGKVVGVDFHSYWATNSTFTDHNFILIHLVCAPEQDEYYERNSNHIKSEILNIGVASYGDIYVQKYVSINGNPNNIDGFCIRCVKEK